MKNFELLDYILLSIALATQYRLVIWPLMCGAVLWLFLRHFSNISIAEKISVVIWRVLVGIAAIALVSVGLLAILSPKGADYYRVVLAALSSIPLVLPAILVCIVRPRVRGS